MKTEGVYELTTKGGATDFAKVVEICARLGPYCLLGGLAVNCCVEPVYTLDADFVVVAGKQEQLKRELGQRGFSVQEFAHSLNAQAPASELRIQFTNDPRYQGFLDRAQEKEILGVRVCVAALKDLLQGKLWAFTDPQGRMTKRKKDELDLLRLAEAFPHLRKLYPLELQKQLDGLTRSAQGTQAAKSPRFRRTETQRHRDFTELTEALCGLCVVSVPLC